MVYTLATHQWTHQGLQFGMRVETDPDAAPSQYDCYDTADRAAFEADEWCFVTVTVTVTLDGPDSPVLPAQMSTSLSGVEYGQLPGGRPAITPTTLLLTHPVPEMVEEVMAGLQSLRRHLDDVLPPAEPPAAAAPVQAPPAEDFDDLRKHLISVHCLANGFSLSDTEAVEAHNDEHDGPCTIRNHDRDDRSYDDAKIAKVLAEAGYPCSGCGCGCEDCIDQMNSSSARSRCCDTCGVDDSHGLATVTA